jgi:S1-C subfamily serine protease
MVGAGMSIVWLLLVGVSVPATAADPAATIEPRLQAIFSGSVPENVEDLRAMQRHVQSLSERVLPASVGVQVDAAQGSGVIVSSQGHVLTAAHVIGRSGRTATIYLPDGRRVTAKTLGAYRTMDAGLLKIDPQPDQSQPDWPHVAMGDSANVALGQWCLAAGHPGGIQNGRQPAMRLGRVLTINATNSLSTDCTLIGGDSGGPLFDMQGNVIAVHSRIGGPLTANLHVPIKTYQTAWERLARGDNWGYTPGNRPFIGVQGEAGGQDAKLTRVLPKSPAEQGGLLANDVVLMFDGQPVRDFSTLQGYVEEKEPGAKVALIVQRGDRQLIMNIVIGRVRE